MILKIFYHASDLLDGPLAAIATIAGDGCKGWEDYPWPGKVELMQFNIQDYAPGDPGWVRRDEVFRKKIVERLSEPVNVRHARPLCPWSRDAFGYYVQYPNVLNLLVRCELFEDDGSPWDPTTARNLYPNGAPRDTIG